jgi:spermidine synthase
LIPWVQLGSATIPGGQELLRLKRRGNEFSIMLGANELMNSRLSGSEEALATLAAARLENRATPDILIGGLGMGFTLRAALSAIGPGASITVSELIPEVAAWARGPMAEVFGGCLDDRRVTLKIGDVGAEIGAARDTFDAILLDVDNGPEGLSRAGNDALYSSAGLASARTALRAGGVLAVWSSAPDRRFTARLKQAGFAVEEHKVRARAGSGARHLIWLAIKPA